MYQYVIYRAKKDGNGLAAQFTTREDNCYLKLARQEASQGEYEKFSWTDKAKSINIKLGLADIGSLLSVMHGFHNEVKLYHEYKPKDAEKVVTQIQFNEYIKDGVKKGYGFSILRAGEKYSFAMSFGESEVVKVLLNEAILGQTWQELKKQE